MVVFHAMIYNRRPRGPGYGGVHVTEHRDDILEAERIWRRLVGCRWRLIGGHRRARNLLGCRGSRRALLFPLAFPRGGGSRSASLALLGGRRHVPLDTQRRPALFHNLFDAVAHQSYRGAHVTPHVEVILLSYCVGVVIPQTIELREEVGGEGVEGGRWGERGCTIVGVHARRGKPCTQSMVITFSDELPCLSLTGLKFPRCRLSLVTLFHLSERHAATQSSPLPTVICGCVRGERFDTTLRLDPPLLN